MKNKIIKSQSSKDLKKLKSKYKSLVGQLGEIEREYSKFNQKNAPIENIFDSLPLESLEDFYNFENNKPGKFLLRDLKDRFKLRKEYGKKEEEAKVVLNDIKMKSIDVLMEKIESLERIVK